MVRFSFFKFGALLLVAICSLAQVVAASTSFSVVDFNTWGVPFAVYDTFRYGQTMDAIELLNPDFVFLEEVFSREGRLNFHSEVYPYEVNGPRALPRLVSGGVRLLSKYPVVSSAKMAFWDCVKDDCLSKKGALLAVIQLPGGKNLNLVVTHLNARGDDSIRAAQIDQIKLFIDEFAEPSAPLLIAGDFNFGPVATTYPYALKTFEAKDTWTETHSASDDGITYNTFENSYAHDYAVAHHFPLVKDRIDFLFTHSAPGVELKALSSEVIFNQAPFYSDHYGLRASFQIQDN